MLRPETALMPAVLLMAAMAATTPVLLVAAGAGVTAHGWYVTFAAVAGWCAGVLISDAATQGRPERLRLVLGALGLAAALAMAL